MYSLDGIYSVERWLAVWFKYAEIAIRTLTRNPHFCNCSFSPLGLQSFNWQWFCLSLYNDLFQPWSVIRWEALLHVRCQKFKSFECVPMTCHPKWKSSPLKICRMRGKHFLNITGRIENKCVWALNIIQMCLSNKHYANVAVVPWVVRLIHDQTGNNYKQLKRKQKSNANSQ